MGLHFFFCVHGLAIVSGSCAAAAGSNHGVATPQVSSKLRSRLLVGPMKRPERMEKATGRKSPKKIEEPTPAVVAPAPVRPNGVAKNPAPPATSDSDTTHDFANDVNLSPGTSFNLMIPSVFLHSTVLCWFDSVALGFSHFY